MGHSAKIRHRRARRARQAQDAKREAHMRDIAQKLNDAIDAALIRAACFTVRVAVGLAA